MNNQIQNSSKIQENERIHVLCENKNRFNSKF